MPEASFIAHTEKMGIDLKSGGRRKGHNVRKAPVSKNVYIKLLEKLYRFVGCISVSSRDNFYFTYSIIYIHIVALLLVELSLNLLALLSRD